MPVFGWHISTLQQKNFANEKSGKRPLADDVKRECHASDRPLAPQKTVNIFDIFQVATIIATENH
jgi:hypothetical protein